jgi:hypothetical protein
MKRLRDGRSERAIAKLLGVKRIQMWRCKMAASTKAPLATGSRSVRKT